MSLFGPPDIEKLKARQDVDGLIKALGYRKDPAVRQGAAQALGTLPDPRSVEPLITALKDENAGVRQAAVKALGSSGSPRAAEVLISSLQDPAFSPDSWSIVEALKALGAPAVDHLTVMLKSKDQITRQAALDILEKIQWQPGQDGAAAVYWIARQDWDQAAGLGSPAVEPLMLKFMDDDWHIREQAAQALGKIGKPAVKPLLAALSAARTDMRDNAALALGLIGDPRAVKPIIALIGDEYMGDTAVEALGRIADVRAVVPLLAAFNDYEKKYMKEELAAALGRIASITVEPFIAALTHKDSRIRSGAAEILDKSGWKPGMDETAAAYWIAADQPVHRFSEHKFEQAVQLGASAVNPLIRALEDEDIYTQILAAKVLAEIGGHCEDAGIRTRIVEALLTAIQAGYGYPQALAQVGKLLEDKPLKDRVLDLFKTHLSSDDESTRTHAVEALDQLGWIPENDRDRVDLCIARQDWEACVRLGDPAVEPLITAFTSSGAAVSRTIGAALVRLYHQGRLGESSRALILSHRKKIIMPRVYRSVGRDNCSTHEDLPAVDFPL